MLTRVHQCKAYHGCQSWRKNQSVLTKLCRRTHEKAVLPVCPQEQQSERKLIVFLAVIGGLLVFLRRAIKNKHDLEERRMVSIVQNNIISSATLQHFPQANIDTLQKKSVILWLPCVAEASNLLSFVLRLYMGALNAVIGMWEQQIDQSQPNLLSKTSYIWFYTVIPTFPNYTKAICAS